MGKAIIDFIVRHAPVFVEAGKLLAELGRFIGRRRRTPYRRRRKSRHPAGDGHVQR